MLDRRRLHLLALVCVAACSKGHSEASKPAASAPPAASTAPAVASAVPPRDATDVPAKLKIDADGITLIETTSGSVVVKTTTLWNAPLEVTYESCEYYLRAIPVMERQVDPKRGAHFKEVCKDAKPADAKSGKGPALKAPVAKAPAKPATSAQ